MRLSILICIAVVGLLACRAKADDFGSCPVAYAQHLLEPSRTYEHEAGFFTHMEESDYIRIANKMLPTPVKARPIHGQSNQKEMAFRLPSRVYERQGLSVEIELVVRMKKELIRYDQKTGLVGAGVVGGEIVRPFQFSFRFGLGEGGHVSPAAQRTMHDHVVPILKAEVDRVNKLASKEFGWPLVEPLEQFYPAEYEARQSGHVTSEEFAFLIRTIAGEAAR